MQRFCNLRDENIRQRDDESKQDKEKLDSVKRSIESSISKTGGKGGGAAK